MTISVVSPTARRRVALRRRSGATDRRGHPARAALFASSPATPHAARAIGARRSASRHSEPRKPVRERVWKRMLRILAAPEPARGRTDGRTGRPDAVIPEARSRCPGAPARGGGAGGSAAAPGGAVTGKVEPFADRLRLSAAERQRLLDLRTTRWHTRRTTTPRCAPARGSRSRRADRTALVVPTSFPLDSHGGSQSEFPTSFPLRFHWARPRFARARGGAGLDFPACPFGEAAAPVFPLEGARRAGTRRAGRAERRAPCGATRAWWLEGAAPAASRRARGTARALARTDAPGDFMPARDRA